MKLTKGYLEYRKNSTIEFKIVCDNNNTITLTDVLSFEFADIVSFSLDDIKTIKRILIELPPKQSAIAGQMFGMTSTTCGALISDIGLIEECLLETPIAHSFSAEIIHVGESYKMWKHAKTTSRIIYNHKHASFEMINGKVSLYGYYFFNRRQESG